MTVLTISEIQVTHASDRAAAVELARGLSKSRTYSFLLEPVCYRGIIPFKAKVNQCSVLLRTLHFIASSFVPVYRRRRQGLHTTVGTSLKGAALECELRVTEFALVNQSGYPVGTVEPRYKMSSVH